MSKIMVTGNAAVITSSLKLEDIKRAEKYAPKALNVMGGENNKEIVFAVGTVKGDGDKNGSINKYGISFGSVDRAGGGFATMTIDISHVDTAIDVKEYLADEIGPAITYLAKIEETLPAVIDEINENRKNFIDAIVAE